MLIIIIIHSQNLTVPIKNDFRLLNFKNDSKKSLNITLIHILKVNGEQDPKKASHEFLSTLPEKFTKKEIEDRLLKLIEPLESVTPQKFAGGINGETRRLLAEGKKVSEVAKLLGKSYQRIKNVEIAMKKGNSK